MDETIIAISQKSDGSEGMTYCFHCGAYIRDQKYCHNCGFKIDWSKVWTQDELAKWVKGIEG